MQTTYVVVTLLAVLANGFSGLAALFHFAPIMPGMEQAQVPVSWLRFPIGTAKTAGAIGLAVGLAGLPPLGTLAAAGLVLFFVLAIYTHVRASDFGPQFFLAVTFLVLNSSVLALDYLS